MNTRFNGKRSGYILANSDARAVGMFAGKTLNQIGHQYGLDDADVRFEPSLNPKTNERIWSLILIVEGERFVLNLARNFPLDQISNADWLLNCEARQSFLSVKDEDGNPLIGEDGKPQLDETTSYLSFGKPSGITMLEDEGYGAFEEPTAADKAKAKVGATAPKPAARAAGAKRP